MELRLRKSAFVATATLVVLVFALPAAAQTKAALVIGNSDYVHVTKLKNPVNDATDMAAALKNIGFQVTLLTNASLAQMEEDVVKLKSMLSGSSDSVGFFYYAGHGVQSQGANYLIPVNADIPDEPFLRSKALQLQTVLDELGSARNKLNIIVLDACRDNPFSWARGGSRGLTVVAQQPPGTIIAYATSAGSVAKDGTGRNGVFTGEFLKYLKPDGEDIHDVLRQTGAAVRAETAGAQVPAVYDQYFDPYYLPKAAAVATATVASATVDQAAQAPEASGIAAAMIRASVAGAEIYVDNVMKGKAPLLVNDLSAGHDLTIVARTPTFEGTATINLKPGEVQDVTIAMKQRTGNLAILSNESAVHVFIDGVDKGVLGAGLFRGIAAGERKLELIGDGLYYSTEVTIPAESTASVNAEVLPVGTIEIKVPNDVTVSVKGSGFAEVGTGEKTLAKVPAGKYQLKASGSGYFDTSAVVSVERSGEVNWQPYTTGRLQPHVLPDGASASLDGRPISASEVSEGIDPGSYTVTFSKPGYHTATMRISVAAGKITSVTSKLELMSPGSVVLPQLGARVELSVDGEQKSGEAQKDGTVRYDGIPSGYPVTVKFKIAEAASAIPDQTVTLDEAGTARLDIPAGRITLPWLPPSASVTVGGATYSGNLSEEAFTSPLLPVGRYQVGVAGEYPFTGVVTVQQGESVEVPTYRQAVSEAISAQIAEENVQLKARKTRTALGVVSMAASALSIAGAVVSYLLGSKAMTGYKEATLTAIAESYRKQTETFSALFSVSVATGVVSIVAAPLLLSGSSTKNNMQQSMDELERRLRLLGE